MRDVREIRIGPDRELSSYNVSDLFMSVPVDKALEVILKGEAGGRPNTE